MRLLLTIVRLQLKVLVQYRTTLMMSIIGEPVYFLINTVYFTALFAQDGHGTVVGYDLPRMIWYFAGVSLVWLLVWNATDSNISRKILSGDLAVDLLRPISTFRLELGVALAGRAIALGLEFAPVLLLFLVFFYPRFLTLGSALRFLLLMPAPMLLSFLINYLVGLAAFYLTSTQSLQRIKQLLLTLTAGGLIPLEFFPEPARRVMELLPFQYLFYWPIQILLNRAPADSWAAFARILAGELLWIGVLGLACRLCWARAVARYCTVGG